MIDLGAGRIRLAKRARMQWDAHGSTHLLLWPERGMILGDTAVEILRLCDGERTLREVVAALTAAHPEADQEAIARDTAAFLNSMVDRALIDVL